MDDIATYLDKVQQDNSVINIDGRPTTLKKQFEADISELFTRGRHFGGLIFMAMHEIDNLGAKGNKNVSNFIIHHSAYQALI